MFDFSGKVGFITGGGTGIGLACAKAIVDGGGKVVLAGRRSDVVREAAERLGESASWVSCDVAREGDPEAAVGQAMERHGALHLAVNSAGTGGIGSVLNGLVSDFERILETNLTGAFRCMRAEAKAMRASGGGSIVNVSSLAGSNTHQWATAYCVSKAGLNMLTRCAADDLGEHNIRVNAVAPSLVPTDISSGLAANDESVQEYLRRMPISRLGTTTDIASSVAFLLSDEASWVTGLVLPVDGGHHLRQGPNLLHQFGQVLPVER